MFSFEPHIGRGGLTPNTMPLENGTYRATCREATLFKAASSGHLSVFPAAICKVGDGLATFYRDGKVVYTCTSDYARVHFNLEAL